MNASREISTGEDFALFIEALIEISRKKVG
jgi:hypothetical protein